jgi:zinc protease
MKNLKLLFSILFIALAGFGFAQDNVVPKNLKKKMPVDESVIIGEFDNGLKYYIKKNDEPKNRAELRLVVNAGSILEDDDQQGLAHFCEHMAFNGTENFKKHELINFLESIGMKFGAELNAYTSFDETVYMLTIPLDNEAFIDTGFMILSDWAFNVSYEGEEIDKERGVIQEEWRLGQGAQDRMRREYWPILFKDSRYANRLPIGTMDVVMGAPHDNLRRFYNDWYRPNLMAVIAVGDFDTKKIEGLIKQYFGSVENPASPKERKFYNVPKHKETLVSVVTDEENPSNAIQIIKKLDKNFEEGTYEAYRQNIAYNLYSAMFSTRLDEKRQESNADFIYGYGGYSGGLTRDGASFMLIAATQNNKLLDGYEAILTEHERVIRHGFTSSELERMKIEMMSGMEKAYNERGNTKSSSYVGEYQRNYLENEGIPGIEIEYKLYQEFIPTITLEEINALAKEFVIGENTVVIAMLPEKEGVDIPSEKKILKIIDEVKENEEIEAYVDNVSNEPLISEEPTPGTVKSENKIAEFDAVEYTLSNGATVIIKQTDFKSDEILFRAFSKGGWSLYSEDDAINAEYADVVIDESGLGNFDNVELRKMLAGKYVGISPYISQFSEGFSGNSSVKDFETLLQLLYLYFDKPRRDSKAYDNFVENQKNAIENRKASPDAIFQDSISSILHNRHPRMQATEIEDLWDADLTRMLRIFMERFSDASDFTFVFVGSINIEEAKPLIEKYIGSLPGKNSNENFKDLGIRNPKKTIEQTIYKGKEDKATIFMSFNGNVDYTLENRLKMQVMADVLSIRLREEIREDEGGVYGISAWASLSQYPEPYYNLGIYFGCAPSNVDKLVGICFDEINKLKENGGGEINLNKVKETLLRQRETSIRENKYWLSTIVSYKYNKLDYADFNKYEEIVNSITLEDIKKYASYFVKESMIKVVLMPEK